MSNERSREAVLNRIEKALAKLEAMLEKPLTQKQENKIESIANRLGDIMEGLDE